MVSDHIEKLLRGRAVLMTSHILATISITVPDSVRNKLDEQMYQQLLLAWQRQ